MLAKSHERIGDIMDTNIVFAKTADDQEAVAGLFKKYNYNLLFITLYQLFYIVQTPIQK